MRPAAHGWRVLNARAIYYLRALQLLTSWDLYYEGVNGIVMGIFNSVDRLDNPLHHLNGDLKLANKPWKNLSPEQGMNFLYT